MRVKTYYVVHGSWGSVTATYRVDSLSFFFWGVMSSLRLRYYGRETDQDCNYSRVQVSAWPVPAHWVFRFCFVSRVFFSSFLLSFYSLPCRAAAAAAVPWTRSCEVNRRPSPLLASPGRAGLAWVCMHSSCSRREGGRQQRKRPQQGLEWRRVNRARGSWNVGRGTSAGPGRGTRRAPGNRNAPSPLNPQDGRLAR